MGRCPGAWTRNSVLLGPQSPLGERERKLGNRTPGFPAAAQLVLWDLSQSNQQQGSSSLRASSVLLHSHAPQNQQPKSLRVNRNQADQELARPGVATVCMGPGASPATSWAAATAHRRNPAKLSAPKSNHGSICPILSHNGPRSFHTVHAEWEQQSQKQRAGARRTVAVCPVHAAKAPPGLQVTPSIWNRFSQRKEWPQERKQ